MKLIYIFIILLITTLSSCSSETEKKDVRKKDLVSGVENSIINSNNIFIDVIMEVDTLKAKEHNGVIKVFFKLDDTIKLSLKDKRTLITSLALVSKSKNKKNVKSVEKINKEQSFNPINPNDTIKIPFKTPPTFSGKTRAIVFFSDIYTLNSYNNTNEKVRVITYEYSFEKDIYIR